ncbi:unnamed protein product, partial [Prorocentrum cordatum]
MSACERGGKWQHALEVLRAMRGAAVAADVRSCSTAASACAKGGDWQRSLALVEEASEQGLAPDLHLLSALMAACQRGRQWQKGLAVLEDVTRARLRLDGVSCDIVLTLCERGGRWERGLALLEDAQRSGVAPSTAGLCALVRACSTVEGRLLREGAPGQHRDRLLAEVRDQATRLLQEREGEGEEQGTAVPAKAGADPGAAASWGVYVVLAMDTLHRHGRLGGPLEAAFRERVYEPMLLGLLGLCRGARPRELPRLALQFGLGTFFTVEALAALGMAAGAEPWVAAAQSACGEALWRSLQRSGAAGEQGGAAREPSVPEEPVGRDLVVWVSHLVRR